MSNIATVFVSEFLRRVRTKWFVLSTLLAPLIIVAFLGISGFAGYLFARGDARIIAVIDETNVVAPELLAREGSQDVFELAEGDETEVRAAVLAGRYDGYLYIPQAVLDGGGELRYFSGSGGGLTLGSRLQDIVNRIVEDRRLALSEAPPEVLDIIRTRIPLRTLTLTEAGETGDTTLASSALGYLSGFIIYLAVFIYGSVVMQGVLEEKQSRVVEVMVSSVRPFELLMGKVLGIGAVGLVQMTLWAAILVGMMLVGGAAAGILLDPATLGLPADAAQSEVMAAAGMNLPDISVGVFVWFLLFFLGGYLFYASMFAAIGSAVEQQQDAQSLLIPIMMPIVFAFVFVTFIIESPNGSLAVIMSMVPLFSPILMVVRLAVTSVPFWQVMLSFALLAGTFVASVWISARIYRVGILMYGKKASVKDLWRWTLQA
jgi:ABC-2 type transport system permease protein